MTMAKPLKLQWVDCEKSISTEWPKLNRKDVLMFGGKKKQTIQQEEWQREQHPQDLTQSPESKPI